MYEDNKSVFETKKRRNISLSGSINTNSSFGIKWSVDQRGKSSIPNGSPGEDIGFEEGFEIMDEDGAINKTLFLDAKFIDSGAIELPKNERVKLTLHVSNELRDNLKYLKRRGYIRNYSEFIESICRGYIQNHSIQAK